MGGGGARAPKEGEHTEAVGGGISGNCSKGSEGNPISHRKTIGMEITAEKTGRSMKYLRFMSVCDCLIGN